MESRVARIRRAAPRVRKVRDWRRNRRPGRAMARAIIAERRSELMADEGARDAWHLAERERMAAWRAVMAEAVPA